MARWPQRKRQSYISTYHFFCKASAPFAIYDLRSTIYDLRSTIYDLRSTIYDLRSTIYDLRSTIYDLRSTIYDLRSTIGGFGPEEAHQKVSFFNVLAELSFLFFIKAKGDSKAIKQRKRGREESCSHPFVLQSRKVTIKWHPLRHTSFRNFLSKRCY